MGGEPSLARSLRVIPHQVDGQVVGMKLYGIRRNSVGSALGLENGDLLRAIDGLPLVSPSVALEVYARLRSTTHLSVANDRRGKAINLTYSIE